MTSRDPALFHGSRSQTGKANYVTGAVNIRCIGLKEVVDADAAPVIRFQSRGGQVKAVRRPGTADTVEGLLANYPLTACQVDPYPISFPVVYHLDTFDLLA